MDVVRVAFYWLDSGVLSGRQFVGPADILSLNTPDGQAPYFFEGVAPDPLRWRVDGGELVDYRPPAPPDTDREVWSWDASAWRWVSSPTVSAARASAVLKIDEAAGRARARYITTAPGQDATYAA